MKKTFLILVLALSIVSCKTIEDAFSSEDKEPEETQPVDRQYEYEEDLSFGKVIDQNSQSLYEVTGADSLASIARKYGVTSDTLIEMNNLQKPYSLKPGMIIKVPTIRTITRSSKSNSVEQSSDKQRVIIIKPSDKKQ
jgi:spore germination protein YaaH